VHYGVLCGAGGCNAAVCTVPDIAWLEETVCCNVPQCAVVCHSVALYQMYKYTAHQLQYSACGLAVQSQRVYVAMNDTCNMCKFVSCMFVRAMERVALEGNHIATLTAC
jgi:hypothetical protein